MVSSELEEAFYVGPAKITCQGAPARIADNEVHSDEIMKYSTVPERRSHPHGGRNGGFSNTRSGTPGVKFNLRVPACASSFHGVTHFASEDGIGIKLRPDRLKAIGKRLTATTRGSPSAPGELSSEPMPERWLAFTSWYHRAGRFLSCCNHQRPSLVCTISERDLFSRRKIP